MLVLEILNGPMKGTVFPVPAGETLVGRGRESAIRIAGKDVSREQLKLVVSGDRVHATSLSAKVPVTLNGQPFKTGPLTVGDRLAFGTTVALLRVGTDVAARVEPDEPADEDPAISISRSIDPLSDEYPSQPGDAASPARAARDRDLLYRIAFQLARAPSEADLHRTLVDSTREGTNADRVALFLGTAGASKLGAVAWSGDDQRAGASYSKTALKEAVRSRKSLLCEDASWDSRFSGADSVQADDIQSVIVVPMLLGDEVRGALYMDCRHGAHRFTPEDFMLATALANQAAVLLLNLRRHEEVVRAQSTRTHELRSACEITANSDVMNKALHVLGRAATSTTNVLLRGESGTGKELAAAYVHYRSPRADRPFVAINCAAIPTELIESELFGHVRGAFAGATENREGRFGQADRGTLFLDEIGEMHISCQAKLLRVLEAREFTPVGSNRSTRVDVRIVAGTNRNLEDAVREGLFRSDLYYRLRVVEVILPPLRERKEDIPLLVERFISEFNAKLGRRITGMAPAALKRFTEYPWPGNIRELKNTLEMAMILADGALIEPGDLPDYLAVPLPTGDVTEPSQSAQGFLDALPESITEARIEFERQWLAVQLKRNNGNISETARRIQLSRVSLHRKIAELGLRSFLKD